MKIGDRVKILTGDYKGQIGIIIKDLRKKVFYYPITVKFSDGNTNSYYESQLEIIKE